MFRKPIAFAALALACVYAHAAGTVRVSFVDAEKFTDFRDRNSTVDQNVKALEKVIVDAAKPHVADGQTLKIDVLDVDLAGEPRPGARAWDVRVLRGRADWPRIKLRWSLESTGAGPRSGDAVVQDMGYLDRMRPPSSYASLAYERRMLDDWFRREFGKSPGG
jgi:Protein of unknown function (DUF3016)